MARENWEQVKDIFVDVVRQEPELRQEFLEKACGGSTDLTKPD
jgi:hypothetical protein